MMIGRRGGVVALVVVVIMLMMVDSDRLGDITSSLRWRKEHETVVTVLSPPSPGDAASEFHQDDDDYANYSEEAHNVASSSSSASASSQFALQELLSTLDAGRAEFPIIIGGIGDSGTRGIRTILRELGAQLLSGQDVNHQGDSQVYEERYQVYDSQSKEWAERRARLLYKMAVHRTRLLSYNSSAFSRKGWEWGRQFIGAMLNKSMHSSLKVRQANNNKPLGVWGMKHPRTMFMLPFFHSALEHRFRFIHVVRDPKHVVSGNNQKMFMEECHRYYGGGPDRKCPKTLMKRYQFWADTNWEVYQFAWKHLSPESYLVVRIEDFVDGRRECFDRLARFVKLGDTSSRMQAAIKSATPYKPRYFGIEMSDRTKREVLEALRKTTSPAQLDEFNRLDVKKIVPKFGYSLTDFQLHTACEDLPGL